MFTLIPLNSQILVNFNNIVDSTVTLLDIFSSSAVNIKYNEMSSQILILDSDYSNIVDALNSLKATDSHNVYTYDSLIKYFNNCKSTLIDLSNSINSDIHLCNLPNIYSILYVIAQNIKSFCNTSKNHNVLLFFKSLIVFSRAHLSEHYYNLSIVRLCSYLDNTIELSTYLQDLNLSLYSNNITYDLFIDNIMTYADDAIDSLPHDLLTIKGELYFIKSMIYCKRYNFLQANIELNKSIILPCLNDIIRHYVKMTIHMGFNDFFTARQLGSSVLDDIPIYWPVLNNLAIISYKEDNINDCIKYLEYSLNFINRPDLICNLAFSRFIRDDDASDDLDTAIKYLDDSEVLEHSFYGTYILGVALLRKYKRTSSLRDLEKAINRLKQTVDKHSISGMDLGIATAADFLHQYSTEIRSKARYPKILMTDTESVSKEVTRKLLTEDENIITWWENEGIPFEEKLFQDSTSNKTNKLVILRRWSSFSPTIQSQHLKGGGYYLELDNQGIVIDPGFDFIENYFGCNLSLDNIKYILISHAHVDHCAELECLLTLIRAKKKIYNRSGMKYGDDIQMIVNEGTGIKYLAWIHSLDCIKGVTTISDGQEITIGANNNINIKAVKTFHSEGSRRVGENKKLGFSLGYIIKMKGKNNIKIGYVSDTEMPKDIDNKEAFVSSFANMDLLILHLGNVYYKELLYMSKYIMKRKVYDAYIESLIDKGDIYNGHFNRYIRALGARTTQEFLSVFKRGGKVKNSDKYPVYHENHLGFHGVLEFIKILQPQIVVLSEFRRELGIYRKSFAEVFNSIDGNISTCFTGDIGLTIIFETPEKPNTKRSKQKLIKYVCRCCGNNIVCKKNEVNEIALRSKEMGIYQICKKCWSSGAYKEKLLFSS